MRSSTPGDHPPVIRLGQAAPPVSQAADRLVTLGLQLAEEWARDSRLFLAFGYRDDDHAVAQTDAVYDRLASLVDLIEAERATTFLGLCVKALAQSWCESSSLAADLAETAYDSSSERLGAAIRREVLELCAAGGGGHAS